MARTVARSSARKKAGKSGRNNRAMWSDPRAAENPESPAVQKEARQQRLRVRLVKIAVYVGLPVAIALGVVAYNAQMSASSTDIDLAGESQTVNDARGKPEAYESLQNWIAAEPSPLPDGRIVSWDGFTVETPPEDVNDEAGRGTPTYSYERHAFTLQRGEAFYRSVVEVAVDDVLGAVVTTTPSLERVVQVDSLPNVTSWFGTEQANVTDAALQSIQTWAGAFTSGAASTLHQATGDQDVSRTYIPLANVDELMEVTVADSAAASEASISAGATEDAIIARVQLRLWWEGGRPELDENERESLPEPITFDVLVNNASTATPVVVAWGSPGEGPTLTPFENAIDILLEDVPDEDEGMDDETESTPKPERAETEKSNNG